MNNEIQKTQQKKSMDELSKTINDPYISALLQFIPGGGSLTTLAQGNAIRMRKEKFEHLINELKEGGINEEEAAHSDEFIHCFIETLRAVEHVHQKEKISKIGELFISSYNNHKFSKVDEFEEYLKIISEVSLKEMRILCIIEDYESKTPRDSRYRNYWEELSNKLINKKLILNLDFIISTFVRLQRTGLYAIDAGAIMGHNGYSGELTSLYYSLRKLISGFQLNK
ncbi:MAG: hypothetical protein VSS52_013125 [Thiotrichaceae bacterium]|nr:hypothetical protein [Thiotrichaceae bacterium]